MARDLKKIHLSAMREALFEAARVYVRACELHGDGVLMARAHVFLAAKNFVQAERAAVVS